MTISLFVMGLDNMREIKFRGMNFCGKWVYGDLRHDRMCMPDGKLQKYISVCGEPVLPISVGQFTGLKDSTGKEIYEGDIIRYKDENGRVYYENDCFSVAFYEDYATLLIVCDECEVVGNVHDNPELLKGDD